MFDQIQEAAAFLRSKTIHQPTVGIILGSGLGGLVNEIEQVQAIDYQDIPHFPISTVKGHAGKLMIGKLSGTTVVTMSGRFHYYEGYTMQQLTFPVRVMKALGVELLIVSNASGSVNENFEAGDLVLIRDHINLQADNPLRGPNDERLGVRFPDMLHAYDPTLLDLAESIAQANKIRAHRGVYVALQGPNLETPAEYEFMHRIGADVVGMSTVPEVIVARHAGLKVFAVSVVSNKSYPISTIQETTHEDVIAMAGEASARLTKLVKELLQNLPQ